MLLELCLEQHTRMQCSCSVVFFFSITFWLSILVFKLDVHLLAYRYVVSTGTQDKTAAKRVRISTCFSRKHVITFAIKPLWFFSEEADVLYLILCHPRVMILCYTDIRCEFEGGN